MNVQGKWTGSIVYGKEYRDLAGQTMFFDLEIVQEGDNIKGNAYDIGGVGISPDIASISGEVVDVTIKFTKRYESYHYYKKGITKVDKAKQGPEIKYVGNFDEKEQSFKGDWIINGTIKLLGLIPVNYVNTGTWSMKRKD